MLNIDLFRLSRTKKILLLFFLDFVILFFSIVCSYSLRLEIFFNPLEINYVVYLTFAILLLVNIFFGSYQIVLRFFNFYNFKIIIKSILISSLFIIPLNLYFYNIVFFPRSVSLMTILIFFVLVVLARIVISYLLNYNLSKNNKYKKKGIILGISNTSLDIINLSKNPHSQLNIVAVFDKKKQFLKTSISGTKVFNKKNLLNYLKRKKINYLILDDLENTLTNKNKIYEILKNTNIRVISTQQCLSLLERGEYSPDTNIDLDGIFNAFDTRSSSVINKNFKNKNILITGAGGSIGSELSRQIFDLQPKKLFLLENSEFALFRIYEYLKKKNFRNILLYPVLCDCNNLNILQSKIKNQKIDLIYHAAAYKHLSLGEQNNKSMLYNNINGLESILKFSQLKKIKHFIFISSDKAVKPTSILGVSKKIGEELVFNFYKKNKGKISCSILRFGNVIGSSGSVLPIFINQLKNQKYLTISDLQAKRYFMSIRDAVFLILNSIYLERKFSIFALDMGEQISIYDVAKKIIFFSGKKIKDNNNGDGDISIKFTGLKKGEKIQEELTLGDNLKKTKNKKILICDETLNIEAVRRKIKLLSQYINRHKIISSKKFINVFK